jgi:hypothetical protein
MNSPGVDLQQVSYSQYHRENSDYQIPSVKQLEEVREWPMRDEELDYHDHSREKGYD